MPSLIRFLFACALLTGVVYGSLYVLANFFEPEPKEISKPLRKLKLR